MNTKVKWKRRMRCYSYLTEQIREHFFAFSNSRSSTGCWRTGTTAVYRAETFSLGHSKGSAKERAAVCVVTANSRGCRAFTKIEKTYFKHVLSAFESWSSASQNYVHQAWLLQIFFFLIENEEFRKKSVCNV